MRGAKRRLSDVPHVVITLLRGALGGRGRGLGIGIGLGFSPDGEGELKYFQEQNDEVRAQRGHDGGR